MNQKTSLDLLNNKYSMEVLKQHIFVLNLIDILKTQHLTGEFVNDFILNKDFQLTEEEQNLTIKDVLLYQPHLINDLEIVNYSKRNTTTKTNRNIFNFEDYII